MKFLLIIFWGYIWLGLALTVAGVIYNLPMWIALGKEITMVRRARKNIRRRSL